MAIKVLLPSLRAIKCFAAISSHRRWGRFEPNGGIKIRQDVERFQCMFRVKFVPRDINCLVEADMRGHENQWQE
jgi:hypothetical protein